MENQTNLSILLQRMDKMQADFKRQNEELAVKFNKSLSITIEEKLKPLIEENTKLKQEVNNLQTRVQQLERNARKNNLVLHGVAENENNESELRQNVIEILNTISQKVEGMHDWDKWEISSVRRLGKKNVEKKRPILLTLTLTWRKYELLKNKRNFPSDIYATEDFPKEILLKRKDLKQKKEQEEKKGKIAFIRYDKLIIKDKDTAAAKRKRSLSKSPPKEDQSEAAAANTKKKPNILNYVARGRSFSTSELPKN